MIATLMIGNQITQLHDSLKKITLEEWVNIIQNPTPKLLAFIERLRKIRTIDATLYKEQKKLLPYGVCGIFHPPIRKKEYFASINCFIVDLDHIQSAEKNVDNLKETLTKDLRIAAAFVSPGNDGLKLLFQLNKPCNDAALFSAFYKVFIKQFAQQYQLESVIDTRTSDVTRACFVSYDPTAYYHAGCDKIEMEDYIANLDYEKAEEAIEQAEEYISSLQNTGGGQALDEDVLLKIKQKLDPNYRPRPNKQYYLPSEITEKMPLIEQWLTDAEIKIDQATPINFGKKLRISAGGYWAEINIFHGKRGFTVVVTPKSGSNKELGELARQLLQQHLEKY